MSKLHRIARFIFLISVLLLLFSCGGDKQAYDSNVSISKDEPAFVPLGHYWVIDEVGVLSRETIVNGDAVCQSLQNDGIAEMVLLVQTGIKQPEKYATHYGRWLKLGKKGPSTAGGNNGIVWLIRPDADLKMTISVGRGLPKFTSSDYGQVMEKAKEYLNFNNYDRGVTILIEETNKRLRELYQ
jgi:uncharacterized membrane protein YgcG